MAKQQKVRESAAERQAREAREAARKKEAREQHKNACLAALAAPEALAARAFRRVEEKAKASLAAWAAKLEADPFDALRWSDGIYDEAARVRHARRYAAVLEGEQSAPTPENPNPLATVWGYLLEEADRASYDRPGSTSTGSNLTEEASRVVLNEWARMSWRGLEVEDRETGLWTNLSKLVEASTLYRMGEVSKALAVLGYKDEFGR